MGKTDTTRDLLMICWEAIEEDKMFPSDTFQEIILNDNVSVDEKDQHYKRFIDDMLGS